MKVRFLVRLGLAVVVLGLVVVVCVGPQARASTFLTPLPTPGPGSGSLPEPGETALLEALLGNLVSGGLALVLVFWILDQEAGNALVDGVIEVMALLRLEVAWKEAARYTAIALAGLISLVAYLVGMVFGFFPDPGGVAAWVNLMLSLLGVSFTGSQMLHARSKSARETAALNA